MARTRFRGGLQPRHVLAGNSSNDRQPATPGDMPAPPTEPSGGRWSLESYPHTDPTCDDAETENP